MWDWLWTQVLKEWGVMKNAPLAFTASVLLASILIVFGLEYFHSEKTSAHEATIALLEKQNVELEKNLIKENLATDLAWSHVSGRYYDDTHLVLKFDQNGGNPVVTDSNNIHDYFFYDDPLGATLIIAFNVPSAGRGTKSTANITGRDSIKVPKSEILEVTRQYIVYRFTGKFSEGEYLIRVY